MRGCSRSVSFGRGSRLGYGVAVMCLFFGWLTAHGAEPQPDETAKLRAELEHRETVIKMLTENLAIARTESELFQKRWAEAQLRAQSLGVDFSDPATTQAQRQLVESVRALYLAEAERQRLTEQLQQLVAVVQTNGDVAGEVERSRSLLAAGEPAGPKVVGTAGTIQAARVLDVNDQLRVAVLNIGELQGARVGMPFAVFRGDRLIARAKVVEVRRRICGALIESVEKGFGVTAGDTARVVKSG